MFWDYLIYSRAVDAERQAMDAKALARDAQSDLHFARDAIERLVLVNRAMWELLAAKTGCTEQELMKKVEELDLSDGIADGKMKTAPRSCTSCGRPLGRRRAHCLYCGAKDASAGPFVGP